MEDHAELRGELDQASGTARVPPIGYQMPSSICMWPMAVRMAGEASGDDADVLHDVVEHLRGVGLGDELADGAGDSLAQAHPSLAKHLQVERSADIQVSIMEPTDFQKKKRSLMSCSSSDRPMSCL